MFLTAESIRRLIRELDPPLISMWDPKILADNWKVDCWDRVQAEQAALPDRYIEGSCFDLTLRDIEVKAESLDIPWIGRLHRETPKTVPLESETIKTEAGTVEKLWRLSPKRSYYLISREFVNCPPWLMGIVHPRMTILQSQCGVGCSFVKPGYSGTIMVEVHVIEGYLPIMKGAAFCSVAFGLFASDEMVRLHQSHEAGRFGAEVVEEETDQYQGKRGGERHGTQGEVWEAQ